MRTINDLIKTIENRIEFLSNEDYSKYDEEYTKHLHVEREVYKRIIRELNYGLLSSEQKQSGRILKLAQLRSSDYDVNSNLNEIKLYSKIKEVLPYIMAVSYKIPNTDRHLTEDLIDFCDNQLKLIDATDYKKEIIFPNKSTVDIAFKCYTDNIKPNKIPSIKVYNQPEVNQKIEELYQLFLELA